MGFEVYERPSRQKKIKRGPKERGPSKASADEIDKIDGAVAREIRATQPLRKDSDES